jgi:heme exporter protein B
MVREIIALVKKDFISEVKSQERIAGVLLYIFTTVLVLFYSLVKIERFHWVGIIWILIIFLSINTVSSSFVKEIKYRHWYYYSLAHPLAIFFSKLIFNFLSLFILNLISLGLLEIFFDIPDFDWLLFGNTLVLCTLGISSIFTFVALISGKTQDQSTLLSILAIPLIFPILMSGSRLMMSAFGLISDSNYSADILSVLAINIVSIGLSIILFPILWRD